MGDQYGVTLEDYVFDLKYLSIGHYSQGIVGVATGLHVYGPVHEW